MQTVSIKGREFLSLGSEERVKILNRLYIERNKTCSEVASEVGISKGYVSVLLKSSGIRARAPWDGRRQYEQCASEVAPERMSVPDERYQRRWTSVLQEGEVKILHQGMPYIGYKCPGCGVVRDIVLYFTKKPKFTGYCEKCSRKRANGNDCVGAKAGNWRGGRKHDGAGYPMIYVEKGSPFFKMASLVNKKKIAGYVYEHRLVMANDVGRCLERGEVVHHINGQISDNRIENLELLPNNAAHMPYNLMQTQINQLKEMVSKLNLENAELRAKLEDKTVEVMNDAASCSEGSDI